MPRQQPPPCLLFSVIYSGLSGVVSLHHTWHVLQCFVWTWLSLYPHQCACISSPLRRGSWQPGSGAPIAGAGAAAQASGAPCGSSNDRVLVVRTLN